MAHAYGAPLNHGHPSVSMSTQPPQHSRPHMHTASRSYSYNIPATSVNVMPGHAPPAYARMSATSDAYGFAQHAHPHPMAFGGGHGPGGVPPRMSKTPGPYGNSAYGGIGVAYNGMGAAVPVAAPLPGWTPPAQYHAPQPNVQPTPQAYGYFQWPSSESVDEIPEDEREQYSYDHDIDEKKGRKSEDGHGVKHSTSVVKKKTGGLFESLRRKVAGPDVHLHTLLLHARPVPLTWDVRNAPASASRGANSSPSPGAPLGLVLSAQERAQYATSPPRSHMRITCDLMPWSIDVVAPGARSGVGDSPGSGSDLSHQQQYITLGHLLDTVHAFLQRRVRRSEWLIANERMQEKVVRAFAWRCYNSPGPRGIEERQGPKRVDWLLKRTVFRGLSRIHGGGEGEEEWELHLGQH